MPKVSYIPKNRYPSWDNPTTGTAMDGVELKTIMECCKKFSVGGKKGSYGCIFPVVKDTLGADESMYDKVKYDGVVFIDLDHLTREIAERIFNSFESLYIKYPFYMAIQYSSSYYLKDNEAGLHLYLLSKGGDGWHYKKYSRFLLTVVIHTIKEIVGIDLIQYEKELGKKVIDTANCKIGQRFHLFHSDYKFNDNAYPISDVSFDKQKDKLNEMYPGYIWDCVRVEGTPTDVVTSAYGTPRKVKLSYNNERGAVGELSVVYALMRTAGFSKEKTVDMMCYIDLRDATEYEKSHGFSLRKHFEQIARVADNKLKNEVRTEENIKSDKKLLCWLGMIVEEDEKHCNEDINKAINDTIPDLLLGVINDKTKKRGRLVMKQY